LGAWRWIRGGLFGELHGEWESVMVVLGFQCGILGLDGMAWKAGVRGDVVCEYMPYL